MRAPPAPPPIMGYGGASPVRALQGMTGGINQIGANPYAPMPTSPRPVLGGTAPPPRPSAAQFNPLNNAGQFGAPKTMVTFDPGTNYNPLPPLTAAGANAPPINPAAPPLVNPPGGTQPLANLPSPNARAPLVDKMASALSSAGANRPPINPAAPPLVTSPSPRAPLDQVTIPGLSPSQLSGALSAAGANRPALSPTNPPLLTPPGGTTPLSNVSSPVSSVPNFGAQPADSAAKTGATFGTSQNRTSPFISYNAADPSRALKLMRGY